MWSQDFLRVLHGAGKVAEQMARMQVPEATTKTTQLAGHARDLARLVPYLMESTAAHPSGTTAVEQEPQPVASTPAAATTTLAQQQQVPVAAAATPIQRAVAAEAATAKHEEPLPTLASVEPVYQTVQDVIKHETPIKKANEQSVPVSKVGAAPIVEEDFNPEPRSQPWTEKHVPSSPLSRILGFGSLAAKLAVGTATEIVRTGGKGGTRNALISDSNAERLAETLCTMRGAALKLGQMLSIQDENLIPSKLGEALERVRQK